MANEVSLATLLTDGGRQAKILSAMLHKNLMDPQTGLRNLMEFKPLRGPSGTLNVAKADMAYLAAAASSEVSGGFSNTALTTGNYDLTPARYSLKMTPTDLFAMTSVDAPVDRQTIIDALLGSIDQTMAYLMTGLFGSVSGNVGTSGADMTSDNLFDAIYYLNLQNNPKSLSAVLHNVQVTDLIESMRGETGAIQYRTDIQQMLGNPGTAYRATILGVDIYQSNRVRLANSDADRQGCMFSQGAFAYTLGDVGEILRQQMIPAQNILLQTPEAFIEIDRDAGNALTAFLLNFYPAVAEQEDLRAVKITTDA